MSYYQYKVTFNESSITSILENCIVDSDDNGMVIKWRADVCDSTIKDLLDSGYFMSITLSDQAGTALPGVGLSHLRSCRDRMIFSGPKKESGLYFKAGFYKDLRGSSQDFETDLQLVVANQNLGNIINVNWDTGNDIAVTDNDDYCYGPGDMVKWLFRLPKTRFTEDSSKGWCPMIRFGVKNGIPQQTLKEDKFGPFKVINLYNEGEDDSCYLRSLTAEGDDSHTNHFYYYEAFVMSLDPGEPETTKRDDPKISNGGDPP